MKVRDCHSCRQQIHKEEQENYLKKEYAGIKDAVRTIACLTTASVLGVQVQRGRTKLYIQELFKDICMMYETSQLFDKPIELDDVMKMLETEYGIDFSKVHVNFTESVKEYVKGCREAYKNI